MSQSFDTNVQSVFIYCHSNPKNRGTVYINGAEISKAQGLNFQFPVGEAILTDIDMSTGQITWSTQDKKKVNQVICEQILEGKWYFAVSLFANGDKITLEDQDAIKQEAKKREEAEKAEMMEKFEEKKF